MSFTLIDETRPVDVDASVTPRGVHLSATAVRDALGWELGPRGLCRGEECVPIPPATALTADDGTVDLAALARVLDRPLALDRMERAACLGAATATRAGRLRSLEAPDFTLPDLDGRPHALSGYRGKKVLLVAWASW